MGRRFNVLALACICTTFVAIDGPLLQRASSVRSQTSDSPISLAVSISPEVPSYYSGHTIFTTLDWYSNYYQDGTSRFFPVQNGYALDIPISGAVLGCPGTCTTTVHAPALALDYCTSTLRYVNYTKPFTKQQYAQLTKWNNIPGGYEAFWTEMWTLNGTSERIKLEIIMSTDEVSKTGTHIDE